VLVAHASPGGKVDSLTRELLANGREVLTFSCTANTHLLSLGARPVDASSVVSLFSRAWRPAIASTARAHEFE
jgi:hypothetical protein